MPHAGLISVLLNSSKEAAMAQANANEYWSENVKEHFHTPPGTFTQDAEEITNILLKVSDGNATLALRRLLFYMNRAGSRLGNAEQLEKAKTS